MTETPKTTLNRLTVITTKQGDFWARKQGLTDMKDMVSELPECPSI